jgi:hypothetical protein
MPREYYVYGSDQNLTDPERAGGHGLGRAETIREAEQLIGESLHDYEYFIVVQYVYHYNSRLYPKIPRIILRVHVTERRR